MLKILHRTSIIVVLLGSIVAYAVYIGRSGVSGAGKERSFLFFLCVYMLVIIKKT
ncbi:MAG: hypothetical protein PUK62_00635 [Prevotellaceae bacterium]|nr:hypothetical protein [Prevotellaceae bacterium]